MKKIKIILLIIFLQNIASGQTIHLSDLQKQILLTWVNENCDENHKNYESLKYDRYFYCTNTKFPEGFQGKIRLYEKGLDKHTIKGIEFFIFFSIFMIILTILGLKFAKIRDIRNAKINNEEIVKFTTYENAKFRFTLHLSIGLIMLLSNIVYEETKDFTEKYLLDGRKDYISIVLPLYNILHKKDSPLLLAIESGYLDIVKYLVEEKNYNPNKKINNILPYDIALEQKSYDIAEYLKTREKL